MKKAIKYQKGYNRIKERIHYNQIRTSIQKVENGIYAISNLFSYRADNIPTLSPLVVDSPYYKYKEYKLPSNTEMKSYYTLRIKQLLFNIKYSNSKVESILKSKISRKKEIIQIFDNLNYCWQECSAETENTIKDLIDDIEIKVFTDTFISIFNRNIAMVKDYILSNCTLDCIDDQSLKLLRYWEAFMDHIALEFWEYTLNDRNNYKAAYITELSIELDKCLSKRIEKKISEVLAYISEIEDNMKTSNSQEDCRALLEIANSILIDIKESRLSQSKFIIPITKLVEQRKMEIEEKEKFRKKIEQDEKYGLNRSYEGSWNNEQWEFEKSIISTPMGGANRWKRR